ncbi:hypothetical protein B0H16DRAFT_1324632 [Mycena metata]|uniref:Uncharacterized protein n=1 Tax=Mycena metata TaxID=1033252 RepID=A0AAD7IEP5_9AGAR|nr:hypothetical protein B0H16DRAFT_1324632 [Mycena metata]
MTTPSNPTSSSNTGDSTVRLLSDPNLAFCPDFSSDDYEDIRQSIDADDAPAAIAKLVEAWTKGNERKKAQWVLQAQADRTREEEEEERRQRDLDAAEAEATKLAEKERLEAEKKLPKLGDFDDNSGPSSFVEDRISLFAQKKLERHEYCRLWPFTPAGLAEAATASQSSAEDGSSITLDWGADNQLTFRSGPSSSTHKNMRRDEDLPYREFSLGWHRYVKEIERAKWTPRHVNALKSFFYGLDTHPLREKEHGDQIILIYADRYRYEWFNTLGTDQSFNIAQIDNEKVNQIGHEYFMKLHSSAIAS